jgi:glycerol-3-phosphate dehydrogenase (NAD(P)+)
VWWWGVKNLEACHRDREWYIRGMPIPVGVLGSGSFGTCLALHCAREHRVTIWSRNAEIADAINREHRNPHYLSDIQLPENIYATADLEEALADRELVICAVPSHGVRDVLGAAADFFPDHAVLVSTVKGIETDTLMRMDQVYEDVFDPVHHPRLVFLSGPSFAHEVAQGRPTAVTLACREEAYAISVQESLSTASFRCYSATDVIGVELGGALKNVIAIAVGICDGLETGQNARAGLMTRGLREITRLGVAMGADPITFLGMAGMGDLVLTCTGDLSRNRNVGVELGRGQKLAEVLAGMHEVAEGIRTTRAAVALASRHGVEMPIAEAVQDVLAGEIEPEEAGKRLMLRQLRPEDE